MMSQSATNLTIKKTSRRVSFNEEAMMARVPSFACLDEDIRSQLWYNTTEMQAFAMNARSLSDSIRTSPQSIGDECVRGLEQRSSMGRRERKYVINKCIVKAQRRCTDATQLASIAHMCSTWSRMAAYAEAKKDFYSAYDIARTCDVPDMAHFPLPMRSNKRQNHYGDAVSNRSRNVRRRTEAILS